MFLKYREFPVQSAYYLALGTSLITSNMVTSNSTKTGMKTIVYYIRSDVNDAVVINLGHGITGG